MTGQLTAGPSLAAITLDARGGGIATVSRLLWRVMQEEWGTDCSLVTLVPAGARTFATGTADRLRFGARIGWSQLTHRTDWVLYSHLAIARVQGFLPERLRRPYGVFLHGIEAWRPLPAEQRRVLAGAAVLLVNSEYTARRIRSVHPWVPELTVCPLTVESTPAFDGASVAAGPWGSDVVLVVGRMDAGERYKGHDELLRAWPAVIAERPAATLVFVGDGDDRARLEAEAQALNVRKSLVTTGFVSEAELDRAYRQAAVFAMPSRNEGFGLVYLEAMLRGLPCVGSRVDAAAEIIEDGVTGRLVDQDAASLSKAVVALLADRDTCRAMGQRGRDRALRQFGYAQFRRRVRSALDGALPRRARATTPAISPAD